MTIFEAIALGGLYWLGFSFIGNSFAISMPIFIMSPLTSCTLTGIILGDPVTGAIVGAAIQPLYLAFVASGGTAPYDPAAGGIVAAAMVITTGIEVDAGVSIAVMVAIISINLMLVTRLANSFILPAFDKFASQGRIGAMYGVGFFASQGIRVLISWVPMSVLLYFGTALVAQVLENLPGWFLNGLSLAGSMMPAIGFAVLAAMIGKKRLLPFFLAGFFLTQHTGLSTIALLLLAAFGGYLLLMFDKDDDTVSVTNTDARAEADSEETPAERVEKKRFLTKRQLNMCAIRYSIMMAQFQTFDRMAGSSFCMAMAPTLKQIYKDDPEMFKEAVKRHSVYFNTEGSCGGLLVGAVVALEEQRAQNSDISGELITSVKAGLMGPLAGVGDSINLGTIQPLLLALCIPYCAQGQWFFGLLPAFVMSFYGFAVTMLTYRLGYNTGEQAAADLLSSTTLKKALKFLGVVGLMVIGGLAAQNISVGFAFTIPTTVGEIDLQAIFDGIIPGLLAFITWLLSFLYIKKGGKVLRLTFSIMAIAFLFGGLGILG